MVEPGEHQWKRVILTYARNGNEFGINAWMGQIEASFASTQLRSFQGWSPIRSSSLGSVSSSACTGLTRVSGTASGGVDPRMST